MSRESQRLFEAMSELRDGLIEEAAAMQKKPSRPRKRWTALAAAAIVTASGAAGREIRNAHKGWQP